jgi:hypothetical protein
VNGRSAQKSEAEASVLRQKDGHPSATKESCTWLNALLARLWAEQYDSMRAFLTDKVKEEVVDLQRHAAGWLIVRRPVPTPTCTERGRERGPNICMRKHTDKHAHTRHKKHTRTP